ncbi:hypothetical protein GCM10007053_18590 [Halioglobus pacificus]|uniref:Uncharacterized protein n=1 Tax=Parahalioglobus pacificus TaxID=930806 RepID=A0A918XIH4_9GAMM|nr:hypothetical protein GCM10007053_18590 [Halioglobus pacificus]
MLRNPGVELAIGFNQYQLGVGENLMHFLGPAAYKGPAVKNHARFISEAGNVRESGLAGWKSVLNTHLYLGRRQDHPFYLASRLSSDIH